MNQKYYIIKEDWVLKEQEERRLPWKMVSTKEPGIYEEIDHHIPGRLDNFNWLTVKFEMTKEELEKYYNEYTYEEYIIEIL